MDQFMSYIKYPKPTPEQFKSFGSETEKYRSLTAPFCKGCGVDIASQGVAVVPWAISFDLPHDEFSYYSNGQPPKGPLHLRGHATNLPFESGSLDFVYSSHLLEDYLDYLPVLTEWNRCVRLGGHIIILVPDKELWAAALARGQAPNCSHKNEPHVGYITGLYKEFFGHFEVIQDKLTALTPEDYSILFVAKRVA